MKTGLPFIAIFLFQASTLSNSFAAAENPAFKRADFEKACSSVKKKSGLCRCLSANVERKMANQEIDAGHFPLVLQAIKGQAPGPEENSSAYDHVADLLAGLEPHCEKNPKYIAE